MDSNPPATPQSAGSATMRQKTRWAVLGVVVLILIVGGWLLWSGKLGVDISQYFAYEPAGYVPPGECGWHGDKISAEDYRYCCPGMVQKSVPWSGPAPTVPPDTDPPIDQDCVPVPECAYDDPPCAVDLMPGTVLCPTPTPPARLLPLQYCVVPGCEAVARAVQCVKAPCEPIVEISCPPGTVIPPRPSRTPVPTPPPPTPPMSSGPVELWFRPIDVSVSTNGHTPVSPGEVVRFHVMASDPTQTIGMTAADINLRMDGQLNPVLDSFVLADFPDLIQEPRGGTSLGSNTLSFVVGSGTDGVIGGEPRVAEISVVVAESVVPGQQLILGFNRGTQVSAKGYDDSVLRSMQGMVLAVVEERVPGDADGDGDVDIFDYNMVISTFGQGCVGIYPPDYCTGDVDGDGDVDIFDYNLVVSNFGTK